MSTRLIEQKTLRVCEWSRVPHGFSAEQCRHFEWAIQAWKTQNGMPSMPVSFVGLGGSELTTRQYVGVIEVGDATIEIYPKLDKEIVEQGRSQPSLPDTDVVMRNLLWMLHVARHRDIMEVGTAHLDQAPTSFIELFAYLLGKNLLRELQVGFPRKYVNFSADLGMVRGRINLTAQVTQNWNRFDRIRCNWDEFTGNTPLNRLLKVACKHLSGLISYSDASALLGECVCILDEADDVSIQTALAEAHTVRFDRTVERLRPSFDLAVRLLQGTGPALEEGGADTFVFLIEMNQLFEDYVHAVIEDHFDVPVERQKKVGTLFQVVSGGIHQKADYYWRSKTNDMFIGDAKYKHLARGLKNPLQFVLEADDEDRLRAGDVLSPDDVRQLTVYAELAEKKLSPSGALPKPNLMLFYPFLGEGTLFGTKVTAWNGSQFSCVPVAVTEQVTLRNAIPSMHG